MSGSAVNLVQRICPQMADVAPLPDLYLTAIPVQAINAGIEDIKVTGLAEAALLRPAIQAFEHPTMGHDGDLAVIVLLYQRGHRGHCTR